MERDLGRIGGRQFSLSILGQQVICELMCRVWMGRSGNQYRRIGYDEAASLVRALIRIDHIHRLILPHAIHSVVAVDKAEGEFAARHRVVVVLKGARTVIADPGGEVFVNPTGNAGMATGGSGDVLTGIIAGLLAQRPSDPVGAAIAGVYLHGRAGDLAARATGMRALVATDITRHLGTAFADSGGPAERV